MTIAASFRCSDGIVLCADTQELTQGYLKTRVPKLISRTSSNWDHLHGVFAGARCGPLIDKLIDEMWKAANRENPQLGHTTKHMEDALKIYYQGLTTLYPAGDETYPNADIIYALQFGESIQLFKASGPIVNQVDRYELAGCGEVISKYIADRFLPRIGVGTVREAIQLSLYMLLHTKEYATGCGGDSHVIVMRPNAPPTYVESSRAIGATMQFTFLEGVTRRLLLIANDLDMTDQQFEEDAAYAVNMLRSSRDQYRSFLKERGVEPLPTLP
jgi:hypothetical protein